MNTPERGSPPRTPEPPKNPLTDAKALEEYLAPYEIMIEHFQTMLYWRNPLPMVALLVGVNSVFWIIHKLSLRFIPTLFLMLTLGTLLRLFIAKFGSWIGSIFFSRKPEDMPESDYVIYPLTEVCDVIVYFTTRIHNLIEHIQPRGPAMMSTARSPLGYLLVMFVVFWLTGTFWLNVVLVNGFLLLPYILLNPQVRPTVIRLMYTKAEDE